MRRETLFVIILHLIFFSTVFSQVETPGFYESFISNPINKDNFIPPSPEAASLGVYGNVPVSLYTGTTQINIPLCEAKSGGLVLPVSLSYNSSGIKVRDVSSRIGLGWSLNAGGVITRVINGRPDNSKAALPPPNDDCSEEGSGIWYEDLANWGPYNEHLKDQPDKYYYNFASYTGSFYINSSGNVISGNPNDLVFEAELGEEQYCTTTEMIGFKITTSEGIIYFFNPKEKSSTIQTNGYYNDPENELASSLFNNPITGVSAWYLSRISHPVFGEITLEYDDIGTIRPEDEYYFQQSQWREREHGSGCHCGNHFTEQYPGSSPPGWSLNTGWVPRTKILEAKVLSKIIFLDGYLKFNHEERWDIRGDKKISSIDIFKRGQKVKTISFNQSYWVPANAGNSYKSKRLRLDGIEILDNNGVPLSHLPHSFEYNSTEMPPRDSYETDAWGYYNNNDANSFLPKIYLYEGPIGERYSFLNRGIPALTTYNGADRSSQEEYMKACTLERINYPTGGSTEFEYEIHSFEHLGVTFSGGGLRIKKTKDYPGSSTQSPVVNSYEYIDENGNTTGTVGGIPQLAYICSTPDANDIYAHPMRAGLSRNGLGVVDGSWIGYKSVKKREGAGNGHTISEFTNHNDQPDIETQFMSGVDVYQEDISDWFLPVLWQYDKWPFLPSNSRHLRRGIIKCFEVYNENGVLLNQEKSDYDFVTKDQFSYEMRPIFSFDKYGELACQSEYTVSTINQDFEKACLIGKEISTYGVLKNITYEYGPDHEKPILMTSSNSDGSITVTKIKYAYDYRIEHGEFTSYQGEALLELQNQQRNPPIEIQTFKTNTSTGESQILSGSIIEYRKFGNITMLHKGYSMAIGQYETVTSLNERFSDYLPSLEWEKDPSYYQTISFEDFNPQGRPLSIKRSNSSTSESFLWNDDTNELLALFINASPSEVAFTDFSPNTFENDNSLVVFDAGAGKFNSHQAIMPNSGEEETAWGPSIKIVPEEQSGKYIARAWVKVDASSYVENSAKLAISTFNAGVGGHEVFPTGVSSSWKSQGIQYQQGEWEVYEIEIDLDLIKAESSSTETLGIRFHIYGTNTQSSIQIDALSLHPSDGIMSSFIYNERGEVISKSGNTGSVSSYEYDAFDRLILSRDNDENILQLINYNYTNH